MGHAITFGDLLAGIGLLVGIATAGLGVLMAFAAGMASSPSAEGSATGKRGCTLAVLGAALFAWALASLLT